MRSLLWLILIGAILVNLMFAFAMSDDPTYTDVPYTFFRQQVGQGNVAEVTSQGDTIQGYFREAVPAAEASDPEARPEAEFTTFQTQRPAFADDQLLQMLIENDVTVNAQPLDTGPPLWQTLLYLVPGLLIIGFFVYFMRRAAAAGAGGGGALSAFGRSRARRYEPTHQRTSFSDVAGIDEAKEELSVVVDFLRHPNRYRRLGARTPKGVLLTGPPGTGKTLLAKAVAGEADVPFFWLSASEFVEMIVGVGASRVRDLFAQAKKSAPSIIFIDELDAIGRSRGPGASMGGSDEREQTLNQILTEMDGFSGTEGVIVLAATNRPEVLDRALLRAGRFDRRVTVNPPDHAGREKILGVHARSLPLADDVDITRIASVTPGMVGADLANLVNEAALLAATRRHKHVQQADFLAALERLLLGSERKIVLSQPERERTAYHESGHALIGMLQPGADPVRKVSIVPRGEALGVTFQSPSADRYGYSAGYLRGRIVGALGGRAAEELEYGETTTGAESDLEQATAIARRMVGRWGMSDVLGPISMIPREEQPMMMDGHGPSDKSRELLDAEVRRIVDDCYAQALDLLRSNRDKLEALAQALLERETLDEDDAYAIVGVSRRPLTQKDLAPAGEAGSPLDPPSIRPEAA
jgi:cell division protease FtsH